MPNAALVPATTMGEVDTTKLYPPLNIRSTASIPLDKHPTTILVSFPNNIPIPDTTNSPVEPIKEFKTTVPNNTDTLFYLISLIYHEPETMIIQLEVIKKEMIGAADTYKAAALLPKKPILLAINVTLKIIIVHLQDHQNHSYMDLNIKPDIKYEASIKTHHSHKSNNHLTRILPILHQVVLVPLYSPLMSVLQKI